MKRGWEYKRIFRTTSEPPMEEIAQAGRDGWEMFWHESSACWYAWWFKRPIEDINASSAGRRPR